MNQQALLHTSYSVIEGVLRNAGIRFETMKELTMRYTTIGLIVPCNPIMVNPTIEKLSNLLDKYINEISITKDTNGVLIQIK